MAHAIHHSPIDSPYNQSTRVDEALIAGSRFKLEGRTISIPGAYVSAAEVGQTTQIDQVNLWATVSASRIMTRGPHGPELAEGATYYIVESPASLPIAYAGRYNLAHYGDAPELAGPSGLSLITYDHFIALEMYSTDLFAEMRARNSAWAEEEAQTRAQIAQEAQPIADGITGFTEGFTVDLGPGGEVMLIGTPGYAVTVECAANALVN
jgi:hypothetical protein